MDTDSPHDIAQAERFIECLRQTTSTNYSGQFSAQLLNILRKNPQARPLMFAKIGELKSDPEYSALIERLVVVGAT